MTGMIQEPGVVPRLLEADTKAGPPKVSSLRRDTVRNVLRQRTALIGLSILTFLVAVALFADGWMIAGDGLFVLLILAGAYRAFNTDAPRENDRGALGEFLFLVVALALVFRIAG